MIGTTVFHWSKKAFVLSLKHKIYKKLVWKGVEKKLSNISLLLSYFRIALLIFILVFIKEKVTKKENVILLSLISVIGYLFIDGGFNIQVYIDIIEIISVVISISTLFSLVYFTNNMRKLGKILLISIIYLIVKIGYFYLSAMYYQNVLAIYYLVTGVIFVKHLIYIVFYCIATFISFKVLPNKDSKTINNALENVESIENNDNTENMEDF